MSDDFGINSTGMGEKATKKPKKKQATQVQAEEVLVEPTPPPGRIVPAPAEQKPGFFSRIGSVFKKKPVPVITLPEIKPQPKSSGVKNLKWVVPKNTKAVYVRVYDENGKVKNTYNISNFITLRPGYTVELNASE